MQKEKFPLGKKGVNQIISPERKKKLMKKLAQIRVNRSRGNNSYIDITAYYETKVRKLKSNNSSLAIALADQRQISKTWYDEVVTIKEELHHSQESLLRCRVRETDEYEHIIQGAVERRMKKIAGPLETSVQDALDNVCGLVDNLTKIKTLVSSIHVVNKEQFNCSRSSQGSHNSRPPLSRTSKSPRKNVVHPMVEGHVLQPATIHLPRMTLKDRRRYRLQERAEISDETGMTAINEQPSVVEEGSEGSDSETEIIVDAEVSEMQVDDVHLEEAINSEMSTPQSNSPLIENENEDQSPISDNEELDVIPDFLEVVRNNESNETSPPFIESINTEVVVPETKPQNTPKKVNSSMEALSPSEANAEPSPNIKEDISEKEHEVAAIKRSSSEYIALLENIDSEVILEDKVPEQVPEVSANKSTKGKHKIDSEDPLEGSSWMHTKRKRNARKQKKSVKGSTKNNVRTSGMHFLLSSSESDEEEEAEKCKPIPLRVKNVKIKGTKQVQAISPKGDILTPPHLDLLTSRVSRRSKKQSNGSIVSSKRSPKENLKELSEELQVVPLESFIIKDDSINEMQKENSKDSAEPKLLLETVHCNSVAPISLTPKTPTFHNVTCLSSTPMDMTECLTKDLLRDIRDNMKSPTVSVVNCINVSKHLTNKMKSPGTPEKKVKQLPFINVTVCKDSDKETKIISSKASNVLDTKPTKGKSNKFFKYCNDDDDLSKEVKPTVRTPFDLSLDTTVDPCYFRLDKENVPPNLDDIVNLNNSNDKHMKLKNISIVVEDIMKTPAAAVSTEVLNSQNIKVSSSLFSSGSSKLSKQTDKRKRKATQKDESPVGKVVKRKKKINFSGQISPKSVPSSADEDWSPNKKAVRKTRKAKPSLKKKLKTTSNEVKEDVLSYSPMHILKEIDSKNEVKSNSKGITTKYGVTCSETNFNHEDTSLQLMLEKEENVSHLTNVYEEVNNLIKMNIANKEDEQDPLAIHINLENLDDDEDEIQVIEMKIAGDPLTVFSSARPRRAASKITSFKEPLLNCKLRRNSFKKPRKQSVKREIVDNF